MSKKTCVTNIEILNIFLHSEFDPSVASAADFVMDTYEIPSVMIMSIEGTDQTDVETLSYKGCTKCSFKKVGQDGVCGECGGNSCEDR